MKSKIKIFFEFNKEKIIIALLYSLFLSIVGNYFFRYNFNPEIAANTVFVNLIYPVEFLHRIIFAPFLNIDDINGSITHKLLLSIFSSIFILFLQYFYYYLVACFIFLLKNKILKK